MDARADMDTASNPAIGSDYDPRHVKALSANASSRLEEMVLVPDGHILADRDIVPNDNMLSGNDMRSGVQGDMITNLDTGRPARLKKDIMANHTILANDNVSSRHGQSDAPGKLCPLPDFSKEKWAGEANQKAFECPDGRDHG